MTDTPPAKLPTELLRTLVRLARGSVQQTKVLQALTMGDLPLAREMLVTLLDHDQAMLAGLDHLLAQQLPDLEP